MSISNTELAQRISALVDRWNTRENQMIAALTQETGNVTVTDGLGQNHVIPSFPQLQLEVSQLVSDAAGAVEQVAGYANAALQHRNAAAASADESAASAAAAATAVEDAESALNGYVSAAGSHAASAASSATAASSSAASAASSESSATSAKDAASASATAASGSQSAATTAAATATTQAGLASTAKVAAEGARDTAALWASAPPNTLVSGGEYSARHYAAQAAAAVSGALVYVGPWDASSGAYPGSPAKGHFYKVSVAGAVGAESFGVGDQIVYSGSGWDKIDNTESVSSVAGKSGAVSLVAGDISGLGALATRSDADWTTQVSGKPSTFAPSAHNQDASTINSGTFANARIAVGNVTQHQASLALAWSQITSGKPTTLSGYGIADAVSSSSFTWANLGSKPTTLSGFGITDAVTSASFTWANLGSKPTTLSGFGITDAVAASAFTWANLGSKPTTFGGLGVTDGTLSTYFNSTGALAGYQLFDRTITTRSWVTYASSSSFYWYSGYASTNVASLTESGSLSLLLAGSEINRAAANSTTLTRQPRIFVGGSDPGAAAADGDLWIA